MIVLKNIDMNFFKKYKNIILINGILATGTIGSIFAYEKSDSQNLLYTASRLEKVSDPCLKYGPQDIDRVVWEENGENSQIKIFCMQLSPSDTWKIRIFRGRSQSTHYRIEQSELEKNSKVYSEWKQIPDNNLITILRKSLKEEIQYKKSLVIRFGRYDEKTNTICKENSEYFEFFKATKEEVETFNDAREKIKLIADSLIKENDSTINKVKKIYDYLIEHTEYRWDPEAKEITSLSIFGKYYMDCGGYTEFMNTALNHIGIESFTVMDSTHGHVWNIVNVDGKYYHLDATYSDTSSFENTSKYRYFLVSDSYMLNDHRYFVAEKDVKCNDIYDLTGIVSINDVKKRGLKGEEINYIKDGLLGDAKESAYSLPFRTK